MFILIYVYGLGTKNYPGEYNWDLFHKLFEFTGVTTIIVVELFQ